MSGGPDRMQCWVVTGPTGSGKSLLTALLAEGGAAIVDADRLGHEILTVPAIRDEIAATFGSQHLVDGVVDRASLGRLVFGDDRELARLNAITHPPLAAAIRRRLEELQATGTVRLAVVEAAVYFLLPPVGRVDLIVAVLADEARRIDRLIHQQGLTRVDAERRVRGQSGLAALWARADIIVRNDSTRHQLAQQAQRLLAEHLRSAESTGPSPTAG